MASEGFWEHTEKAQACMVEASQLRQTAAPVVAFGKKIDEIKTIEQMIETCESAEAHAWVAELERMIADMVTELDALELESFLSGPHDKANAILSVHAGAGGTESCDWADMLLRMYTRWAERSGYGVEVQDMQPGDEAGVSRATVRITGRNAYGYIRAERGVHRLVRISPFDSNQRRHTSFAAVDVVAEIEDDVPLEIRDEDLRIDTYRSSGKGGQHVNKTESAIRITHLPTNIVVTCQNERSQIKNRAMAMKILRAKIYEKMQDEKRSEMEKFYGEKGEIGWGNQIRSYVMQPYQLVKDLRTGVETGNVTHVLDGDLDMFIHAWLRAGCPRTRTKEILL